jgi:RimJ/RimL family protein N-acetyltransferase
LRPIYLTGERVYLRGMLAADKEHTIAWYNSPLPLNSAFGEAHLNEIHQLMWDATRRQYAIVQLGDERIIGGAVTQIASGDRKASVSLHMAPLLEEADSLQAEAIKLLVPWLLDDHNMRRVNVTIASSDLQSIAAADELGMFAGVRLREFWRRPGGRVDALIYQILNPNEEHRHA